MGLAGWGGGERERSERSGWRVRSELVCHLRVFSSWWEESSSEPCSGTFPPTGQRPLQRERE